MYAVPCLLLSILLSRLICLFDLLLYMCLYMLATYVSTCVYMCVHMSMYFVSADGSICVCIHVFLEFLHVSFVSDLLLMHISALCVLCISC